MEKPHTLWSSAELRKVGPPPVYTGERLAETAFPLGGMGTGCVSLVGTGGLRDWEILNRPNKGSIMPYTFGVLWVRQPGRDPVTRVLQGPPQPPYSGQGIGSFQGFGFGVERTNGSGLPPMRTVTLGGAFPIAEMTLSDPALPVRVMLEAYSPFIPLNPDDSGLPIAVLNYTVHNQTGEPLEIALAFNLFNPLGYPGSGPFMGPHLGQNLNSYHDDGLVRGLAMTTSKVSPDDPAYGTMALMTTWPDTFCQCSWLRGGWFDALHDFWDHFSRQGTLAPRDLGPSDDGASDVGTLGLRATVPPEASVTLPILLGWHFPTFIKYWGGSAGCDRCDCERPRWRNYYASQWHDATEVVHYFAANQQRLHDGTRAFTKTLLESTLPDHVLDALSSQASILHSPTVLRLEDGTFYGFEGCHGDAGCCEGSCTHVWNYAQTVAYLFPSLERSLRDADYIYNQRPDGHMAFRLQLPLGSPMSDFHAAADGQLGGILKVYRDWQLCGDDAWLRRLWPKVVKALEYAWEQWDPDRDGVITGIQHNTYDIEFVGPNTMIGSFYLGALHAAERMALHLGDTERAALYHTVYERGRAATEDLFNGEYYIQRAPDDPELKYQYGEGCLSDQLIGQWFAHIVGLGHILDPDHVRSAIQAVFRHNWQTDFWEHANPQRIYALNDEQGLLLCSWPRGNRPRFPFVYSDEVWCGIEYQVASHLIYEGFVDEGLAVVKGVRARHDGKRRNPWNEFECGSHYARSLASWSVLLALSGFQADAPNRRLAFAPKLASDPFECFWSTASGWGAYRQSAAGWAEIQVEQGSLTLAALGLGTLSGTATQATVEGRHYAAECQPVAGGCEVRFERNVEIGAGQTLRVALSR